MRPNVPAAQEMLELKGGTRPLDGLVRSAPEKTRPEAAFHLHPRQLHRYGLASTLAAALFVSAIGLPAFAAEPAATADKLQPLLAKPLYQFTETETGLYLGHLQAS